jgi:AraC family transcriptional regulator of adaptative response/methylated-DNA-[protein]-cysteine methyltransferase
MDKSGWKPEKPQSRKRKERLQEIISARNFDELRSLAAADGNIIRALISFLFDSDELVRWRSLEAVGIVAEFISRQRMETAKDLIRRFFWMMNDESGNICWYAPEAIGEILFNIPSLIPEFGLLLASFLNEEPFEGGVRRAIARTARAGHDIYNKIVPTLEASLSHTNPTVRGYSLLAIKELEPTKARQKAAEMTEDSGTFSIYDFENGTLRTISISEIARDITA